MRNRMGVWLASGLVAAMGTAAAVQGGPAMDKEGRRTAAAPGGAAAPQGSPAAGPGVISDGFARIVFAVEGTSSDRDGGFELNIEFPYAHDHGYEVGWFIRGPGDETQVRQPLPATATYQGDTAVFTWTDVATIAAEATLEVKVDDTSAGRDGSKGAKTWTLTISNTTSQPQEINVFTYVDLDLADSSSDHTATLLQANNWMEVLGNDKGPTIGEIRGIGADRYAVTTHSDLRDELNGPEPITLGNTGLPYGPGDFAGGLQWQNRTLPANGSLLFQWVISVDESALLGDRLFADEFDCSWFESCPGQVFTNLPALEEDDATTGLSDVRRKAVMFYTEYYEATTIDQLVLRLQDYDLTGEVVASLKAFDVDNMQAPGELLVSFTAPPPGGAGIQEYVFTTASPFVLQPNTMYWLEVGGIAGGSFDWMASTTQGYEGLSYFWHAAATADGVNWSDDFSVFNYFGLTGTRAH